VPPLQPPRPVDGATMMVEFDGTSLTLQWSAPATDVSHGPADRYRVTRATDPRGPYTAVAVVTAPTYQEELPTMMAAEVRLYRIVAANAAGDAP